MHGILKGVAGVLDIPTAAPQAKRIQQATAIPPARCTRANARGRRATRPPADAALCRISHKTSRTHVADASLRIIGFLRTHGMRPRHFDVNCIKRENGTRRAPRQGAANAGCETASGIGTLDDSAQAFQIGNQLPCMSLPFHSASARISFTRIASQHSACE